MISATVTLSAGRLLMSYKTSHEVTRAYAKLPQCEQAGCRTSWRCTRPDLLSSQVQSFAGSCSQLRQACAAPQKLLVQTGVLTWCHEVGVVVKVGAHDTGVVGLQVATNKQTSLVTAQGAVQAEASMSSPVRPWTGWQDALLSCNTEAYLDGLDGAGHRHVAGVLDERDGALVGCDSLRA